MNDFQVLLAEFAEQCVIVNVITSKIDIDVTIGFLMCETSHIVRKNSNIKKIL